MERSSFIALSVSYPNYNKTSSTANVYLKKDSVDFVLLKYSPTIVANESLSISPSSINFGTFSKPTKSGLFLSAKPSSLATASTVILNASITYAPIQMTGFSYSSDRTRIYISGNNFGYISSVQILEGSTEIDSLIIENQTTNLLVLKASKNIDLVSGIDYIFRVL